VLNDLQAEFGTAPAAEESKKAKCSPTAFPKLFKFREVERGPAVVTPLPEDCCSTSSFTTGYKRLAEGGLGSFLMGEWIDWWAA
jgi:hypothetical protein